MVAVKTLGMIKINVTTLGNMNWCVHLCSVIRNQFVTDDGKAI